MSLHDPDYRPDPDPEDIDERVSDPIDWVIGCVVAFLSAVLVLFLIVAGSLAFDAVLRTLAPNHFIFEIPTLP